jgi:hypothetical protein
MGLANNQYRRNYVWPMRSLRERAGDSVMMYDKHHPLIRFLRNWRASELRNRRQYRDHWWDFIW